MLAADVADLASCCDRDRIAVPDRPGRGVDVEAVAVCRCSEVWWTVGEAAVV